MPNKVELVKRFPINEVGRDFVIGDLHGHFRVLDNVLEQVGFDKTKDRCFSVGDLVDRGPDSADFDHYIFESWFHAVRGNHEQIQLQRGHDDHYRYHNGGSWFVDLWEDRRNSVRAKLGQLPVAIEVETKNGKIGLVHANVPGDNWDFFTKSLVDWSEKIVQFATWDRSRWRYSDRVTQPVQMIDHVFVGHCAHNQVRHSHNVTDLDTGCGYEGGRLTLWSIDEMKVVAEGRY